MLVSSKLPPALREAIDARAAGLGVSRSAVIRALLEDGLARPAVDGLPAGPHERLEAVRGELWRLARGGFGLGGGGAGAQPCS